MGVQIQIGAYTIERTASGKLWLVHETGEGMEVNEAQLAEWLAKFYAEQF